MPQMRRALAMMMILVLNSACASQLPKSTNPATGNDLALFLIEPGKIDEVQDELGKIVKDAPVLSQYCVQAQPVIDPFIVPIVSSLGKFWFDQTQDRRLRKLQELKKAAQRSYSVESITTAGELRKLACVAVLRFDKAKKLTRLIAIARITHYPSTSPQQGFAVQPVLLLARDSVAKTSKAKSRINVTLAVTTKAIGTSKESGLPSLQPLAASAIAIPHVSLSGDPKCDPENPCRVGALMPHLQGSEFVSISVGVTETGILGIDFDTREAEIKAIKEAFGPAVKDALKAELEDD